jgi:hypothetical protein
MTKKITERNAKEAASSFKVALAQLPPVALIHGAVAAEVGNLKYGSFNYRESEISMMMYLSAILRHTECLIDGEDVDELGVSHEGYIIAGSSIILDGKTRGNLIDDRPPSGKASEELARLQSLVTKLRKGTL